MTAAHWRADRTLYWPIPSPSTDFAVPSRPLLFFSHANSFPAGTYRALFARLENRYRIASPERYGHDPAYPVTDGWPHLVRQAAHELALARRGHEPVILVGHSLGGFLSLKLAAAHPQGVQAVVMLDSPVIQGWRAAVLMAAKRVGLASRIPPASIARRRRDRFASGADALSHFRGKAAFAQWPDAVLADYVACGLDDQCDTGAQLRFAREVEASIYGTLPHDLGRVARRLRRQAPDLPIGFIQGTHSAEIRQVGMAGTRALVGPHVRAVDGGHLFPMEQPDATADALLGLLDDLLSPALPRAA